MMGTGDSEHLPIWDDEGNPVPAVGGTIEVLTEERPETIVGYQLYVQQVDPTDPPMSVQIMELVITSTGRTFFREGWGAPNQHGIWMEGSPLVLIP